MPTPADDRFERLFANKPRPAKPDVDRLAERLAQLPLQQADENASLSSRQAKKTEASLEPLLSSDEDDEYTALFVKKPEMKTMPTKLRSKPEAGAFGYAKDATIEPLEPIEYIPEGKRSIASSKSKEEVTLSCYDQAVDTPSVDGQQLLGQFCVFPLVAKFPYKYMKDPNDRVSRRFFANNKFYVMKWDLHYLHPPQSFDKAGLVLVPLAQVQELVNEISSAFKITVDVPPFPFTLSFYDDSTPQPVYLGTSTSRQEASDLIAQIPATLSDSGECPPTALPAVVKAYEKFHEKVQGAILASKGKGKDGNAGQKKAKKLLDALQESRNQLRRAQRYFGLRPQTRPMELHTGLAWEEQKAQKKLQEKQCGLFFNFLNIETPAQHPFEHEPVMVSIDVESYERNHGFITEIGISILDTLDILDVPPGPIGSNWVRHIRSRHFRIKGREHLVNMDFVAGNPDAFQFGKSEFISLDEVADAVDRCFEWPYSVDFKISGPINANLSEAQNTATNAVKPNKAQKGSEQRNLLILGHDVGTDLEYLRKLGSEIFGASSVGTGYYHESFSRSSRHRVLTSIIETLDTATLYKIWKEELQPRSLGSICDNLGIDTWFLHNAGNDARYTLEALVGILVQSRLDEDKIQQTSDPGSEGITVNDWEAKKMRQIDDRLEIARQKVERKVADRINEIAITAPNTEAQDEVQDEGLNIDWSVPLHGEKVSKQKRYGKQGASTAQKALSGEEAGNAATAHSTEHDDWQATIEQTSKKGW